MGTEAATSRIDPYLLVDEIDKMTTKDEVFLLNLMETGIVSETNTT
jgi:hypothetical protein